MKIRGGMRPPQKLELSVKKIRLDTPPSMPQQRLQALHVLIDFHAGFGVYRVEPGHSAGALGHGGVKFPERSGGSVRPTFHLGNVGTDGDAIQPVTAGTVALVECLAGLFQWWVAPNLGYCGFWAGVQRVAAGGKDEQRQRRCFPE